MYKEINRFLKIAFSTSGIIFTLNIFQTSKAAAVSFNFSYQFSSGNLLSGNFEGELGLDGDTINNISNFKAVYSALPGVTYNNARIFTIPNQSAVASLSGNRVNIFGTNVKFGIGEGFLLGNPEGYASLGYTSISNQFLLIGGTRELDSFNINSWKATIASVPESSMMLGLITLGSGLLALRRKSQLVR